MGCLKSILRGFGFSLGMQAARSVVRAALPGPDDATKACPQCAETIKAAARKCRFCGADLG